MAGERPLTLTARDGIEVARAMPGALTVPLHYEGWQHFSESRTDLEAAFAAAEIDDRLRWPRGPETSLAVARRLVVFLKPPGGQAHFSAALAAQQAARPALRELQAWIAGHLGDESSVSASAPVTAGRLALARSSEMDVLRRTPSR